MTYTDGQIIVRVALETGPNDARLTDGDPGWTDLTSRVKAYRDDRGRQDPLQPFPAGTAQVTLDNGDRALDPSNPDGLLFDGTDPIGLPLCQVKVTQWWNGAEHPRFFGYLGPEAWPGDQSPYGNSGETVLNVVDAVGYSPELPPDTWGILIASLHPEWWSRMDDFEFPVLDDASPVPNSIGDGNGTVEGSPAISRAWNGGVYDSVGIMSPGLLLAGDHQVRFPATGIMPDGDEDKFTVALWWSSRDDLATGQADVAKMVDPADDTPRWSIYIDSADGDAYVTTYDAGGTPVDTATINSSILGRWDAPNSKHLVIVESDGADEALTVWFGGDSATLSAPAFLYESDLIVGPGNGTVDSVVDEVATWRQTFPYDPTLAGLILGAAGLSWWAGQTFADRLGGWIEATGRDVSSDDTNEWHLPAGLTDSLWGLIRNRPEEDFGTGQISFGRVTLPATLADAFQATVAYGGGERWATKSGWLRARIMHSLTDPAFAAHYATPVLFTDEDGSLGTDEYRHAGVEVTGLRIDRVVNDASVQFLYSDQEPPDIDTATELTCRSRDTASIRRYGRRTWETDTEWADWPLNQTLAELVVDRFAQPRQEFENIHLDPLNDDSLAAYLIVDCELEQACTVTYTSEGADPVTVEGLNIQRIAFDWTPERWSVDILAAAS